MEKSEESNVFTSTLNIESLESKLVPINLLNRNSNKSNEFLPGTKETAQEIIVNVKNVQLEKYKSLLQGSISVKENLERFEKEEKISYTAAKNERESEIKEYQAKILGLVGLKNV